MLSRTTDASHSIGNSQSDVAWVLLRGLGREAAHWSEFPHDLSAAFPNAVVLTPDLPGTGAELATRCPLTVPALARAVRAGVCTQHASKPIRLVGLSLGSMVALSWAQQFPHEVAGLALLSGSVSGVSPWWRRLRPRALAGFVKAALCKNGIAREKAILALTSSHAEARQGALPQWAAIAGQRHVSRVTLARQLAAAARFRPRIQPLRIPTLILAGASDRIVHPQCSVDLGRHLHAAVSVHPNAGHDLVLDAPKWVVQQLQQWMNSENVTKAP